MTHISRDISVDILILLNSMSCPVSNLCSAIVEGCIRLGQPEKSVVAERRFEMQHIYTCFSYTAILDKAPGYMARLIKEAIEIRLHPRSFKWDGV
jgi:hypothetical protein